MLTSRYANWIGPSTIAVVDLDRARTIPATPGTGSVADDGRESSSGAMIAKEAAATKKWTVKLRGALRRAGGSVRVAQRRRGERHRVDRCGQKRGRH